MSRTLSRLHYPHAMNDGAPRLLPTFALSLKNTLWREGAVIVDSIPYAANAALLDVASMLGDPVTAGTHFPDHPLEDEIVYRIEPRNEGQGIRDENDRVIFSTTDGVFDCHTDGYHNRENIDVVLMLCVRGDAAAMSIVAHIDDLLDRLDPDEQQILGAPVYPSLNGPVPILDTRNGRTSVRFNLAEIERFLPGDATAFTPPYLTAARHLNALSKDPQIQSTFSLQPGQCLVLDNRRVLHGRLSLSKGSRRLLKRVWLCTRDYPSH
jgi:hypothetical protein